jgi:Thaumatin family
MNRLDVGALGLLLASSAMSPAFATCVSKKCSDAAVVQQARETIQQTCGCMRGGQTHRAYMACVKSALKPAKLAALGLQRPCRNAVMRCESKSICGQPDAVVCCRTKKSGKVAASMRKSAAKCKNGIACGASLGLYSTFDACGTTGTCAQEATTTTTPTVTTTTIPPLGCGAERAAFEASLPVPTPGASGYVVQLVNESSVTLLAAADAAHQIGQPPFPVLPREKTWVMPPMGVLTIDIPLEWQGTVGTKAQGALGPLFWARTGCRFDIDNDIAQCETGQCGGFYDCSKAKQTAPGAKALAEWTFNDPNNRNWSFPDISVVDGVNLNMDIQPIGGTAHMPMEPKWLDHPLVKCGGDQRDLLWCPPTRFQLRRKDLAMFIAGSEGGDDVVGCFSNCGLYKYPVEPALTCNPDPATDVRCYYWKTFCAGFPVKTCQPPGDKACLNDAECTPPSVCKDATSYPYDVACTSNATCTQNGTCWNRGDPNFKCPHGGGGPACCALTAFNKQPDCPADQCTFPYTPQTPQNQPPFGLCSTVTAATGDPDACIGDDTFHYVMPYGLTWPNDPETFSSDAHIFRVIFQPGGTNIPITDAGPIPMCSDLPPAYNYQKALMDCSGVANKVFASAVLPTATPPNWACKVTNASIPNGVLCRW